MIGPGLDWWAEFWEDNNTQTLLCDLSCNVVNARRAFMTRPSFFSIFSNLERGSEEAGKSGGVDGRDGSDAAGVSGGWGLRAGLG